MTFLFCGELAELDVVRQNGEAELRMGYQYSKHICDQSIVTYEDRSVCREAMC
jgi:hypothetical protein